MAHTPLSTTPDPTLESCADEPIRIPGAIQPHGFLLALDATGKRVAAASENAAQLLRIPLRLVLGSTVDTLFERELLTAIQAMHCVLEPESMVTYMGSYRVQDELYSVLTHCVEGRRVLEFERQDRLVGAEMMNAVITNFVGALSKLETTQELCDAITGQVAQLTGFDRVLLYSFDEEGHGTVLSERNSGRLPSYLDLRFPATDIPRQARDLYVLNTVRIIPDAYYTPSPIHKVQADAPHVFDLSMSVLRSVSPIHLQYMKNMGTVSSMSISIISEGRLWGLIGAHHAEPRLVPYLVRSACDMLSKLVGTQLTTFRTAARLKTLTGFHSVQRQLLTHVASQFDYLSGLATQVDLLQRVTSGDGVALYVDGVTHAHGAVPPTADIVRLVDWLDTQAAADVFVTRELGRQLPSAANLADVASGLLAIRISDVRQRYILWFRPQVVHTVRWAGEPAKSSDAQSLSPRTSFESWQQIFRGQSTPWTDAEIESAREFRAAMNTVALRRAEEEAELSNARFEQLTGALPEKVFSVGDNGELLYVNQRWMEQGLESAGLWYGGGHLAPEEETRIAARWQQAVRTGEPFEEEMLILGRAGRPAGWNLVRVVPFKRSGASRAGWVGSMTDLTERREREVALRMTEKLALTGRMTSVIAHEINNPLEAITNLLYLVRTGMPDGAEAHTYLAQAENELERISGITKQTLRWNRETSGEATTFTAGAIFTDVLRLFRGRSRNRHVTVTVRGGEKVVVSGIVGQLRQVIANLVSNAIDAANLGGNVWMEARHQGGTVEFIVADDGVGIPPEQQAQLFQPFFSTKGDLGNGLGLYISQEIVERHGGRISVDTEPGNGTVFHVRLPAIPVPPTSVTPAHAAKA